MFGSVVLLQDARDRNNNAHGRGCVLFMEIPHND